jgi:GGDEF domain-containing protein
MKLFDRIDRESLEQRADQLWVLALSIIVVLATGLALMMYTVLFAKPDRLTNHGLVTLFVGYCSLVPLLVGYLIDRQFVIKRLRRRIREDQNHIAQLEQEVRTNLLENLPGLEHFQDRLAMEYRRALRSGEPFSVIMAAVKLLIDANTVDSADIFGEAARALASQMRGEDSVYYFGQGTFGLLLPRMASNVASLFAGHLSNAMDYAVNAYSASSEIKTINFPEDAVSARAVEKHVLDFLSAYSETALRAGVHAYSM